MTGPSPPRLLPPLPPWLRFAVAGALLAALAYALLVIETSSTTAASPAEAVELHVRVPELDGAVLATARDQTLEQRLLLEPEPLRHLLAKAIDVGPTVAAALGMPESPVPVAELRADPARWRGQWLWYEGPLELLAGPRAGHPIDGYAIHEATIRLPSGDHAMAAFSMAPAADIKVGDWVRIDGYLLKLRDTTYPLRVTAAPLLVGRSIQRDYEDWPAITTLDPAVLAKVEDASFWPGDPSWHSIEEDQTEALWHLAAFARDTADQRTLADWRRIEALSASAPYERLIAGKVPRGAPMRVFGTLIRRQTLAAPTNPAGIKYWTTAWLQVREFGGQLVPVWVPKRVRDLPLRAQLEVRGLYYRWFAYETDQGKRFRTPLFVAADLDLFDLETDATMRTVGLWIGGAVLLLLVLVFYGQLRMRRTALAHARDMDRRRRKRREMQAAPAMVPLDPPAD